MKKVAISSLLLISISNYTLAQKGTSSVLLNAGTTITLTESSYYKPGLHLGGIFGYGVSTEKNDAVTAGVGYHTFQNRRITSDVVKMMDIKVGFRFFPSAKAAIYFHPSVGVGFFTDASRGKAKPGAGIALGYLPKIGSGNLNIFGAYNRMSFSTGISLLNFGVGYQFNFKGK